MVRNDFKRNVVDIMNKKGSSIDQIRNFMEFLDGAFEIGKEEGYEDGVTSGYKECLNENFHLDGDELRVEDAYENGWSEGHDEARNENEAERDEAYREGYEDGKNDGYDGGYEEGLKDGENSQESLGFSK